MASLHGVNFFCQVDGKSIAIFLARIRLLRQLVGFEEYLKTIGLLPVGLPARFDT